MGILTDFFIATEAEAKSLPSDVPPKEQFPTFESKGIDPVKLATLQTILAGGDLSNVEGVVGLIPEAISDPAGEAPMVFPVPTEIVTGLIGLDANAFVRVGEAWFNTEEFQMDGWPRAVFDEWFAEFCEFMKKAHLTNTPVFLWICV